MTIRHQDKKSSSNKAETFISTENCPDMVPIYTMLRALYEKTPDTCPTLIVVENLPGGMPYIKCSDILMLKRGIPLDDTMTKDNYYYRDSIPLGSFKDFSYDIYGVALVACNRMNIKCPQIILSNELNQLRGVTWQGGDNLTKLIQLKPGMSTSETMEVLLHELRHAWQHEKHHSKYFIDYRFLDTGIDLRDYMMQPAEIDAEAFSVRMMVDMGLEKYPVMRKKFDDVNNRIEARAKRMCFPNSISR